MSQRHVPPSIRLSSVAVFAFLAVSSLLVTLILSPSCQAFHHRLLDRQSPMPVAFVVVLIVVVAVAVVVVVAVAPIPLVDVANSRIATMMVAGPTVARPVVARFGVVPMIPSMQSYCHLQLTGLLTFDPGSSWPCSCTVRCPPFCNAVDGAGIDGAGCGCGCGC